VAVGALWQEPRREVDAHGVQLIEAGAPPEDLEDPDHHHHEEHVQRDGQPGPASRGGRDGGACAFDRELKGEADPDGQRRDPAGVGPEPVAPEGVEARERRREGVGDGQGAKDDETQKRRAVPARREVPPPAGPGDDHRQRGQHRAREVSDEPDDGSEGRVARDDGLRQHEVRGRPRDHQPGPGDPEEQQRPCPEQRPGRRGLLRAVADGRHGS